MRAQDERGYQPVSHTLFWFFPATAACLWLNRFNLKIAFERGTGGRGSQVNEIRRDGRLVRVASHPC